MRIYIKDYIKTKSNILINSDIGYKMSIEMELLDKVECYGTITIVLPSDIIYISETFMIGFLYDIVKKYKYNTYDIIKFDNSNSQINKSYLSSLMKVSLDDHNHRFRPIVEKKSILNKKIFNIFREKKLTHFKNWEEL